MDVFAATELLNFPRPARQDRPLFAGATGSHQNIFTEKFGQRIFKNQPDRSFFAGAMGHTRKTF